MAKAPAKKSADEAVAKKSTPTAKAEKVEKAPKVEAKAEKPAKTEAKPASGPSAARAAHLAAQESAAAEHRKTQSIKTRRGVVLSNKMDKTVVVEITRPYQHNKYGKFLKQRIRHKAHDADNKCNIGDIVVIEETRPLSKDKRWRVTEIAVAATTV